MPINNWTKKIWIHRSTCNVPVPPVQPGKKSLWHPHITSTINTVVRFRSQKPWHYWSRQHLYSGTVHCFASPSEEEKGIAIVSKNDASKEWYCIICEWASEFQDQKKKTGREKNNSKKWFTNTDAGRYETKKKEILIKGRDFRLSPKMTEYG